jgi:hypothetical protein
MEKLFVEITPENESLIRSMRAWPQSDDELRLRVEIQREEIESPLNVNGTREEYHLSTEEEEKEPHHVKRIQHYLHCGRAQELGMIFDLAFSRTNVHGANLCTGCDVRLLPVELRVGVLLAHLEMMLDLWRRYPKQFGEVFGLSV